MPFIDLEDVGLLFRVRQYGRISFKEYLLRGLFRRSARTTFEVQALEQVARLLVLWPPALKVEHRRKLASPRSVRIVPRREPMRAKIGAGSARSTLERI